MRKLLKARFHGIPVVAIMLLLALVAVWWWRRRQAAAAAAAASTDGTDTSDAVDLSGAGLGSSAGADGGGGDGLGGIDPTAGLGNDPGVYDNGGGGGGLYGSPIVYPDPGNPSNEAGDNTPTEPMPGGHGSPPQPGMVWKNGKGWVWPNAKAKAAAAHGSPPFAGAVWKAGTGWVNPKKHGVLSPPTKRASGAPAGKPSSSVRNPVGAVPAPVGHGAPPFPGAVWKPGTGWVHPANAGASGHGTPPFAGAIWKNGVGWVHG